MLTSIILNPSGLHSLQLQGLYATACYTDTIHTLSLIHI